MDSKAMVKNSDGETLATLHIETYGGVPPKNLLYGIFSNLKHDSDIIIVKDCESQTFCSLCKLMDGIETKRVGPVERTKNYVFKMFSCGHLNYSRKVPKNLISYTHIFEQMKKPISGKNTAAEFYSLLSLSKLENLTEREVRSELMQFNKKRIPKELIQEFLKNKDPVWMSNSLVNY